jgi:hypothetical protein
MNMAHRHPIVCGGSAFRWLLQIGALVLLLCLPAAAGDPTPAPADDAPLTLGQVMEQNGGSLLRAQRQTHVAAALPLGSATDGEPAAPTAQELQEA